MKTVFAAALLGAACFAQSVAVVNSGSTNAAGFRIVVEKSGQAEYTSKPRRGLDKGQAPVTIRKTISKSLADSLYADVKAASPLASLPPQSCMKSASFGSRLTVEFGDDVSPDLSCGDDGTAKMQALIRDAKAVVKIFRPE
ncbi:MAG TPA: hypothetical protein VK419_07190 [Bryobacteraceae bacterium]|nr:hypothetical protein [Bryobacteraceae bacterium]